MKTRMLHEKHPTRLGPENMRPVKNAASASSQSESEAIEQAIDLLLAGRGHQSDAP